MKTPTYRNLLPRCLAAVRSHYGITRLGLIETRAEVLNCARKAAKGSADDFAAALTAGLEVASGMPIAELAKLAEEWPTIETTRAAHRAEVQP